MSRFSVPWFSVLNPWDRNGHICGWLFGGLLQFRAPFQSDLRSMLNPDKTVSLSVLPVDCAILYLISFRHPDGPHFSRLGLNVWPGWMPGANMDGKLHQVLPMRDLSGRKHSTHSEDRHLVIDFKKCVLLPGKIDSLSYHRLIICSICCEPYRLIWKLSKYILSKVESWH